MSAVRPVISFVGEAMVELTSTSANTLEWTFAGDVLNAAASCSAAGHAAEVRLLTGLGDDDLSDQLARRCQLLGIDPSDSVTIGGRTLGLYWIDAADGERRFRYWREHSAAREALESGRLLPALTGASHLVWSGITLSVAGAGGDDLVHAMANARAAGATVCFDVNHRPSLWPDTKTAARSIDAALAHADLVTASSDDIGVLWPDDGGAFADRALTAGASEIIVSDGPGRVVCTTSVGTFTMQPEPTAVVDTVGAGDALWGTYLGRRHDGADPESALVAAVSAARLAVGHAGALGYLGD